AATPCRANPTTCFPRFRTSDLCTAFCHLRTGDRAPTIRDFLVWDSIRRTDCAFSPERVLHSCPMASNDTAVPSPKMKVRHSHPAGLPRFGRSRCNEKRPRMGPQKRCILEWMDEACETYARPNLPGAVF